MHLLLTDRLSCPRCGPAFGLVLLAERMEARRVQDGTLGCPNCRDQYPIREGFADLRVAPRRDLPPVAVGRPGAGGPEAAVEEQAEAAEEQVLKMGALLGVTEGPGALLLQGPSARWAPALAERIGGVEVVALDLSARSLPESEGVSRMTADGSLPFFAASFRAVWLEGPGAEALLEEGARVVAPGGRVVLAGTGEGGGASEVSPAQLEPLGLAVLLREGGHLVAVRKADGPSRLIPLRGV